MAVIDIEFAEDKPGAVPIDGKMRVGDCVEFLSDRQTEKGPSAGTVTKRDGNKVVIKHSDHPGEEFDISTLRMRGELRHRDGISKLWLLS